jgi:hypothetical protein
MDRARRRRPLSLELHQHVIGLCAKREISLGWCQRPSQAWAARGEFEEICIPPIKSRVSYATALHEIGHILGRHQQSRDAMVRERWAWQWAKANALIWTPAMDRYAGRSLGFAAKAARTRARG